MLASARRTLTAALALSLAGAVGTTTAEAATSASRIAGSDRYATSAAISRAAWTPATTRTIYLASGKVLADALAAGTLTDGPVLLTDPTRLPAVTDQEITRLGDKPVVVLGGPASVSDAVARQAARRSTYTRLAGPDRHATSVAISQRGFTRSRTVYLADSTGPTGQGSADAVAGGALTDGPILLVNPRTGPTAAVRAEIRRLGATRVVQLGRKPLGVPVTEVLGGPDRYATSVLVAQRAHPAPQTVYLARGDVFADAVSAGSLTDGPVVLTSRTALPPVVCTWLRDRRPGRVVALGGATSVDDGVLTAAKTCAGGVNPAPTPTPAPTPLQQQAAMQLAKGFAVPSKAATTQALDGLRVAAPGPMTGYSRELFPHWRDASTWGWPVAPSNACNTRNAALWRDGVDVTINASCTVQSGRWLDPYTATWYADKTRIDIDHMVPLAAAWRSGAAVWSTDRRTAYANDPLVVVSVEDAANQAKGDKTPDAWKPLNRASWCLYAKRYVAVKSAYALTVTPTEKTALTSMLGTCTS